MEKLPKIQKATKTTSNNPNTTLKGNTINRPTKILNLLNKKIKRSFNPTKHSYKKTSYTCISNLLFSLLI